MAQSDVKPIITHFHKWMKENGYSVSQILNLLPHALKDNYPQHMFEAKLQEFGYTPLDKKGFFDVIQADGKPGQVSIPKL